MAVVDEKQPLDQILWVEETISELVHKKLEPSAEIMAILKTAQPKMYKSLVIEFERLMSAKIKELPQVEQQALQRQLGLCVSVHSPVEYHTFEYKYPWSEQTIRQVYWIGAHTYGMTSEHFIFWNPLTDKMDAKLQFEKILHEFDARRTSLQDMHNHHMHFMRSFNVMDARELKVSESMISALQNDDHMRTVLAEMFRNKSNSTLCVLDNSSTFVFAIQQELKHVKNHIETLQLSCCVPQAPKLNV